MVWSLLMVPLRPSCCQLPIVALWLGKCYHQFRLVRETRPEAAHRWGLPCRCVRVCGASWSIVMQMQLMKQCKEFTLKSPLDIKQPLQQLTWHRFLFHLVPISPFPCVQCFRPFRGQEASLVGTSKWQKLTLEGREISGESVAVDAVAVVSPCFTCSTHAKHCETTDALQHRAP